MEIYKDDLTDQAVVALLQEHLEHMHAITPPESIHALDLDALKAPNITFWTAWEADQLLGCGALKELDSSSGEVKSMRTASVYRRRGVASTMLKHIIETAKQRAYDCLYLETGAGPEFAPARTLYTRYGFEHTGLFADYSDDPNSVFMRKTL